MKEIAEKKEEERLKAEPFKPEQTEVEKDKKMAGKSAEIGEKKLVEEEQPKKADKDKKVKEPTKGKLAEKAEAEDLPGIEGETFNEDFEALLRRIKTQRSILEDILNNETKGEVM